MSPRMHLRLDESITRQKVRPGIMRRILPYAKPYRWLLLMLVLCTAVDSVVTVTIPLMLRYVIDDGIIPRKVAVVVAVSLIIAGLALLDALAVFIQTRCSAQVGQGLIFNLRGQVFRHVQQQPMAFFTRTQTGSLVSRLNTDVIGAQQAITVLLSQTISTLLTLILVLVAMFYLSWQISLIAVVLVPCFIIPGRWIGRRLQRLTRENMQLDAQLGSMMNERFNVAGAMLSKLYGRPNRENALFEGKAGRVRDVAIVTSVYGRSFAILMMLLTSIITAVVYGLGGTLVIRGILQIGTLVAMVSLLNRMYGPLNQLTNMQVNVMTTLVSFDRVFEVLDLKPLVADRPGAVPLSILPGKNADAAIEFDRVSFRYPAASEVSLASLESIALPMPEFADQGLILDEVSFRVPAGQLTALVGPSGGGKTTITYLVSRLYDPISGTVRLNGQDIKDVTLDSLHDAVGVVTQDAHLFHDTIRANLLYAAPDASEKDLIEACKAARIWDTIASFPNMLDTIVGDRGYRMSGGEKQRISLARLLLKNTPIVVLDEATAHLDSESEAAIQQALKLALENRTSLVIAHRLSTVRDADQILVVEAGRIRERGTHEELLVAGELYADLYRTQFSGQAANGAKAAAARRGQR